MGLYNVKCTCGEIEVGMQDEQRVRGFCHC